MELENINHFLESFFSLYDCPIDRPEKNLFSIQLNRELDEALMNRPFYWHYMDKLGQQGAPMTLKLNTDPESEEKGFEWIHFGSPRLQQIFSYIQQQAMYTLLYEKSDGVTKTALYPWLVGNIKVSYLGKQKKEEIFSIGLHLINGIMLNNMMKKLENIPFQRVMSDYSYTLSPIIKPPSGFYRIFQYIENEISTHDNSWAIASLKTLQEEKELLDYFFQHNKDVQEFYENEERHLTERLEPKIEISIINAGLFYLSAQTVQKLIQTLQ